MSSELRRAELAEILRESVHALTGSQLSERLGVTRQVIVADIALLRAAGEGIIATPQGYLRAPSMNKRPRRALASRHSAALEHIREELNVVVDYGGTILDVIIEHPLYGEITGSLHLSSRHDVEVFIKKLQDTHAEPLSVLTGGLHLHTIEAKDEATLTRIVEELARRGFLEKDYQ
ncbi:MAG: transcriptional regulator [Bacillota bacterium]|nr:MAG: transcriptional regulator [Bacillota bacterium]MBS3950107.1 transcription repressor NadR [Peptococcaceae bacterium]